jgi:hypothetical protein
MRPASISILALLSLAPLGAAEPPAKADFYVATNGSDRKPGTWDKPFATLARARDAVRQLKAGGALKGNITVLVRGGTYLLEETLVFGPEDSGTAEHRIVYAAYPGEKPILSGGRPITGWKRGEGKTWLAQAPGAKGGGWRFTQLFVNGKRQTRACLPDTDDWHKWWRVAEGPNDPRVFKYPEGSLKEWPNVEDMEINVLAQYYWLNQIMPLKQVDGKARTATLVAALPTYAVCPNNPFRVENVPEGVTRPGTWCLNTKTGTVTLWPEDGVDPTASALAAPVLPVLVRCEGQDKSNRLVRGLTFRGLTFTQTARVPLPQRDPKDMAFREAPASALLLQAAEGCAVEGCRFVESGEYGLRLSFAARNNRVTGNEFVGCGGGGIRLTGYGPGTRDVNKGNVLADNHIHHCSVFYWHASGIYGTQSGENVVAFNHIHDMPYSGISFADASAAYFREFRGKEAPGFGFRWDEIGDDPLTRPSVKRFTHSRKNRIAYNVIHHVMQRLEDGGAVYLGFEGGSNVVRGNLIHGVRGGRMAVGIYTDAESDRELIEGNVAWDCDLPRFDNGEEGNNNNRWGTNVLSRTKVEPPQAKILRDTIAAMRKKGVEAIDDGP